MAMLEYSQTGISARALEEAKRRLAGRGTQTPYPSTVSGLTEGVTEREVNRAQVAGEDPEEAMRMEGADPRRISTMLRAPMSDMQPAQSPPMQLREPMTGAPQGMGAQPMTPPLRAPMVAPEPQAPPMPAMGQKGGQADPELTRRARIADEDRADRAQAEALNRRARRDAALTAIMTALPDGAADVGAVQAASARHDPNAPIQARAASRAAEEEARIAEEERALNTDYRQTLMRSMDVNANRREDEMRRTGERDTRNYDPASAEADAAREFLRRAVASAPGDMRAAFDGMDLDALGARDIQWETDRVLRRIGQVPMRERTTEQNDILAALGPSAAPEPTQAAPETAEAPAVQAARRRLGRPAPGATAAVAPAAPATRRDRTVAQINADRLMERRGQPPPSGYSADDLTPGEADAIARDFARRGNRSQAAALAGGIDTRSREAQMQAVNQQGTYNQQDINRASVLLAPVVSRRRQTAGLLARARDLSDAEFAAAMQNSPAFLRTAGFNVETFNADFRALTNVALREASGAAVTDQEAQRFFAALSSNSFSSKAAFMSALQRMLAEDANNARAVVPREEVRNAYFTQLRGGR